MSPVCTLLKWWAHQDLNLGPKDYEQLEEIKSYINQQVTSVLQRCGSKCGSNSSEQTLILENLQLVLFVEESWVRIRTGREANLHVRIELHYLTNLGDNFRILLTT